MLFGHCCAQTTYFVQPTLSQKMIVSSFGNPSTINYGNIFVINEVQSNPYVHVRNVTLSARPSILLGVNIGCSLNNRHHIKFGIAMDEIGSMVRTLTTSKDNFGIEPPPGTIPSYNNSAGRSTSSHAMNQLNIEYSRLFNVKNSIFKNIMLNFGTSLFFGKEHFRSYSNDYNLTIFHNNSTLDSATYFSWYTGRTSVGLKFGIGFDLRVIRKAKELYLFTFDLNYIQGFRVLSDTRFQFAITDNNDKFNINYYSFSRGSGLYFQISRRIHLKKIKPGNQL